MFSKIPVYFVIKRKQTDYPNSHPEWQSQGKFGNWAKGSNQDMISDNENESSKVKLPRKGGARSAGGVPQNNQSKASLKKICFSGTIYWCLKLCAWLVLQQTLHAVTKVIYAKFKLGYRLNINSFQKYVGNDSNVFFRSKSTTIFLIICTLLLRYAKIIVSSLDLSCSFSLLPLDLFPLFAISYLFLPPLLPGLVPNFWLWLSPRLAFAEPPSELSVPALSRTLHYTFISHNFYHTMILLLDF